MENKKFKFNFVDAVVVIALVAVIAFAVIKLGSGLIGSGANAGKGNTTYRMTFFTEESTWYSLENLKVGDEVSDDATGIELGDVVELNLVPESCAQLPADDGTYKVAPRPGYGSGSIVFEFDGEEYEHGAKVKYSVFSIGQTVTLRVGKSKVYGRVMDIENLGDAE